MRWKLLYIFLIFAFTLSTTNAQTAGDLQGKIDARNAQIEQLEEEIKQYNLEVTNAGKEAKTLQGTLKTLDLTQKKINTDINLTQNKISKATLTIEQLGGQIDDTESKIETDKLAIINALRDQKLLEDTGIIEIILSNRNIGDIWKDIDSANQIRNSIRNKSKELKALKTDIESKQSSVKVQKNTLLNLQEDLNGKKKAVQANTQEKATLLALTKNKEQTFMQRS